MPYYRLLILITLTSVINITPLNAATLSILAKYGNTGGLVGDLNSVGDTVNGRNICPDVNKYSNNIPGCDMSSDSGFSNNGTSDPSDDFYTGDLIVRTNDSFQVLAGYNWTTLDRNNEQDEVTLTGTLPSGTGFIWDSIPAICDSDSSSIEDEAKTIICNRKDIDTIQAASFSEDIPFIIRVEGDAANGSTPGDIQFTITDVNSSLAASDGVHDGKDDNLIKVTASPRWNIEKSGYTVQAGKTDESGNPGWWMWYNFTIEVDEIDQETDTANPKLGNEALQGGKDATVSFIDDLSDVSPNAKLVTWDTDNNFDSATNPCSMDHLWTADQPFPSLNRSFPERSIPVLSGGLGRGMDVTCDQTGSQVTVTVTGIDGTLTNSPSQDSQGRFLPVNRGIAAIGVIRVFVPVSDVVNGKDGIADTEDDAQFIATNCITDFAPLGISGTVNFSGEGESEIDNCYDYTLATGLGEWVKNFRRGWSDQADQREIWGGKIWYLAPTDASEIGAGDGTVSPDSIWGTYVVYKNTGSARIQNPGLCDVIDVNTYEMTILDEFADNPDTFVDDTRHAVDLNYSTTENIPGLKIEYATGYVGSWPPNPLEPTKIGDDELVRECEDPSVTWYPDVVSAETADGAPVSKVRISADSLPSGKLMSMRIRHKARNRFLATGELIPSGTQLVNYATYKSALTNNLYRPGDYYPDAVDQPPGSGTGGDRLTLVRGKVRITKEMNPGQVSPNLETTVSLLPSFTTESESTESAAVTVVDLLPKGLEYLPGTTNGVYGDDAIAYAEPQVIFPVTDADCTTHVQELLDQGRPCGSFNNGTGRESILTWNLGTQITGTVYNPINFNVIATIDAPLGTLNNYALISSPIDPSPAVKRSANANVINAIPSALLILKSAVTESNAINSGALLNWMEFQVALRNGSAANLTDLDVIDLLPFNGDGAAGSFSFTPQGGTTLSKQRFPATSYSGILQFDSVSFDDNNGECQGTPTFWFTNNTGPMDISPLHSSNTIPSGSVNWCEGTLNGPNTICGFGKADVTAVRVTGPNMDSSATCYLNVKMATSGNSGGDIYASTASGIAAGVSNATLSNTVAVNVVASAIGNRVWQDSNNNGVQDAQENGASGIVVRLLQSDGITAVKHPSQTTSDYQVTTNSNGEYLFNNLELGDYVVKFEVANSAITQQGKGTNNSLDSDADPLTGKTGVISVNQDQQRLDIDAGIFIKDVTPVISSELRGEVRLDKDSDGNFADNDAGISQVTLELLDENSNLLETTQTTGNGHYSFSVDPGSYIIREIDPAGHTSTNDRFGVNDNHIVVTLFDGEIITGNDFLDTNRTNGQMLLCGQVRLDDDADGDFSDAEQGIPGVNLDLMVVPNDNVSLDSTQTDSNGNYCFILERPGHYTVREADLSGITSTNDIDFVNDNRISQIVKNGTSNLGNDFLDTEGSSVIVGNESVIIGQVRRDTDGDGDLADNDAGVAGVTIELLTGKSASNVIDSVETDANGYYKFLDISAGTYTVRETDPSGMVSTNDFDGGSDNLITLRVKTRSSSIGNDFIDTVKTATSGFSSVLFVDQNKNGVKDPEENGVSGWTCQLSKKKKFDKRSLSRLEDEEIVETIVSQANGSFTFPNLEEGEYTLRVISPGGLITKEILIDLASGNYNFVPEPIDPFGVVYNEVSGTAVSGAQLFLSRDGVDLPEVCIGVGEQGQLTDTDGTYAFFLNPGAAPECPLQDTVYELQIIPPVNYLLSASHLEQPDVLQGDDCTIDAVVGITCEVSAQTAAPISGHPEYYVQFDLGADDPGIFNNHIPLTPPDFVDSASAGSLDIDGNGEQDALSDGLLITRYLFGLTGNALTTNAVASNCTRCSNVEIEDYLDDLLILDVDANGASDALSDGLLIIRYLLGLTGNALTTNAVASNCTRCSDVEIEDYLGGL